MSKDRNRQALVPRLRFTEFHKDGAWQPHVFAEVVQRIRASVSTADIAVENYVSTENLLPDFGGVAPASNLPPLNTVTQFRTGDTLLANIRPYLNKAWFATRSGGASNDVFVFRSRGKIDPRFLSHRIRCDVFIAYVMSAAKGVKMPRGDLSHIEQFPLPLPKNELEQLKIADCLGSLDDLITAQRRKLAALRDHKKGLMQQLFPREGETRPRLRFSEFQEAQKWGERKFYDLLDEVIDFRGRTPKKLGLSWGDGTIISLSANNVKNGYIDTDIECNLGSEELYERWMGNASLEKGDIVFTMEAPLGNALLISDSNKYILSQRVVAFKMKPEMVNQFILQLIWSPAFQKAIELLSTGSTAKGVSQKTLQTLEVRIPKDEEEQQRIADCLSALDAQITAQAKKLDALRTHKHGLMQRLFPAPEGA